MFSHDETPYDWVGAWSEKRASLSSDSVGLVDATTGERFTYAELDRRANRVARLLREEGVAEGERVAVLSRNRPELVDLFFATAKTGGVLAPLSHRLAADELVEMLDDVDPALLVVEAPFAALAAEVLAHDAREFDCSVVALPAEDADATTEDAIPDREAWDDALPADDSPVETADLSMNDPHLFLHTGGSTGVPKETVLTHGSVLWNSFNTITAWGLRPEDVTPMVFPMFHTGGWNVITVPLFHLGGTVVLAREFEPGEVLRLAESEGATVLVAVPAVLRMMATHDDWETTDLSTLRFVKSGGGPCRESVMEAWWDRGVDLSQGYGLTECGPNNFTMPEGWPREKADSVGVPAMHVDARVVSDDGDRLPAGEIGELELASPHAAAGYWRNPEETRETFGDVSASSEGRSPSDRSSGQSPREDEASGGSEDEQSESSGGWVSTGDLARRDDEGYVYIEGRKKNMYVSGGENVYPAAVEDRIADHPNVEEVVVVPVPDDQWGQVGKAVVQGDESLTLEELTEFLDGRLARFKRPRHLAFVDEMPTSGPQKIDRQAVEERFGEA
ncbi:AMP-binding protein [Halorussus aquaticus]|uniref:AMP-binding protein n=1 Tax=Halorussus aquaticus TaxID=2953748 RepID=A0ABD5Q0C1_9EURY|nr:AMP-binding protein [Halorussus aquaticus]